MDCSIGFLFPAIFFLPAGFLLPVPEGGELSITAGGMTVGHVTCGPAGALTPSSPKGANRIPFFFCSPPSGTSVCGFLLSAGSIPFGHSTRGYWEFAPFGDVSVCESLLYLLMVYFFLSVFVFLLPSPKGANFQ